MRRTIMKKAVTAIVLTVLASSAGAQKLHDAISIGLNKAEQVLKAGKGNVTETVAKNQKGISVYHNGINAELVSCVRAGEQVWIDFLLKNYSSTDKDLEAGSEIYDQSGVKVNPDYIIGGKMDNSPWPRIKILAGLTIKYRLVLRHFIETSTSLPKVALKIGNDNFTFGTVLIQEPQNTNMKNVICALPTLQFNLESIEREGSDVKVKFMMISSEEGLPISFLQRGHSMYDSNGNVHNDMSFKIGNNSDASTLPKGIPTAGSITIHNVPTDITSISMLKCVFFSGNIYGYYIKIRDGRITMPQ